GLMKARYLYDVFGNLISKSGPLAESNLYRFSSKEVHPSSGMYYYGYRFYEPVLQRWLSRDPIGLRGGRNLHQFAANDPANRFDTYGLQSLPFGWHGPGSAYDPSSNPFDGPECGQAAAPVLASMVPGVGEAMDLSVLVDPDSTWWERGLSG